MKWGVRKQKATDPEWARIQQYRKDNLGRTAIGRTVNVMRNGRTKGTAAYKYSQMYDRYTAKKDAAYDAKHAQSNAAAKEARRKKIKRAAAIGGAVVATGLAVYGVHKISQINRDFHNENARLRDIKSRINHLYNSNVTTHGATNTGQYQVGFDYKGRGGAYGGVIKGSNINNPDVYWKHFGSSGNLTPYKNAMEYYRENRSRYRR